MNEPILMSTVFGMNLYLYGICAAASVLCGCLFLVLLGRARQKTALEGVRLALYAIPLCLLFSRLGYCLVRARFIAVDYVPYFPIHLELGGYSLAGGFLGLLLAVWLYARTTKGSFAESLDWVAPAALFTLVGLRMAESSTLNGVGIYIDNEMFSRFPFAVPDVYGEFVLPVFFWEAVTALVIGVVLTIRLKRAKGKHGDVALTGMLLVGLTQVFWESLREDDFLRFGFVRVNQLWGVLLAVVAIGIWLSKAGKKPWQVVSIVLLMLTCIGLLIVIEFGLDKLPIPNEVLYAVMIGALIALTWVGLSLRNHHKRGATASAGNESADRGDCDRLSDHR